MKKPFFTTMAGSWVKVFLSAIIGHVIAQMANGQDIFKFDMAAAKTYGSIGLAALLPMVYNYLNPNYPMYGPAKDAKVIDTETGKQIAP